MVHEGQLAPATMAFNRLAADYDRLAAGELFEHQRRRTHAVLDQWIPAGGRVLEIGCGTGIDTAFLATRGNEVVACDPSREMQRLTLGRTSASGAARRVQVIDCGLENLPSLLFALGGIRFDAVISNFGALNCVGDLSPLRRIVSTYLRPGGSLLLCVMGRHCLWELAYLKISGRAAEARRRRAVARVPVAGIDVPTFYHTTEDIGRALGSGVALTHIFGIGVLSPPPYLEPRWRQAPALLRAAVTGADRLVASWPIVNRCGDHVLTRWVKRRDVRA
ncbi:MAG TPA: class I SAM-dependent methyltransferase [Vicinamibacterales bacterium]|jgi:SAM-dependent methyltransferase|nr:class I SAM-dependent methyltransferase [Vicinamibacterales bacterium]